MQGESKELHNYVETKQKQIKDNLEIFLEKIQEIKRCVLQKIPKEKYEVFQNKQRPFRKMVLQDLILPLCLAITEESY